MRSFRESLQENSFYNTTAEKDDFLKEDKNVIDAFFYGFVGWVSLLGSARKKDRVKAHFRKDQKLRVQTMTDDNEDVSLSIKIMQDKGAFKTITTANEMTRFLVKAKMGQIDDVDPEILLGWIDQISPTWYMKAHLTLRKAIDRLRAGGTLGLLADDIRWSAKRRSEWKSNDINAATRGILIDKKAGKYNPKATAAVDPVAASPTKTSTQATTGLPAKTVAVAAAPVVPAKKDFVTNEVFDAIDGGETWANLRTKWRDPKAVHLIKYGWLMAPIPTDGTDDPRLRNHVDFILEQPKQHYVKILAQYFGRMARHPSSTMSFFDGPMNEIIKAIAPWGTDRGQHVYHLVVQQLRSFTTDYGHLSLREKKDILRKLMINPVTKPVMTQSDSIHDQWSRGYMMLSTYMMYLLTLGPVTDMDRVKLSKNQHVTQFGGKFYFKDTTMAKNGSLTLSDILELKSLFQQCGIDEMPASNAIYNDMVNSHYRADWQWRSGDLSKDQAEGVYQTWIGNGKLLDDLGEFMLKFIQPHAQANTNKEYLVYMPRLLKRMTQHVIDNIDSVMSAKTKGREFEGFRSILKFQSQLGVVESYEGWNQHAFPTDFHSINEKFRDVVLRNGMKILPAYAMRNRTQQASELLESFKKIYDKKRLPVDIMEWITEIASQAYIEKAMGEYRTPGVEKGPGYTTALDESGVVDLFVSDEAKNKSDAHKIKRAKTGYDGGRNDWRTGERLTSHTMPQLSATVSNLPLETRLAFEEWFKSVVNKPFDGTNQYDNPAHYTQTSTNMDTKWLKTQSWETIRKCWPGKANDFFSSRAISDKDVSMTELFDHFIKSGDIDPGEDELYKGTDNKGWLIVIRDSKELTNAQFKKAVKSAYDHGSQYSAARVMTTLCPTDNEREKFSAREIIALEASIELMDGKTTHKVSKRRGEYQEYMTQMQPAFMKYIETDRDAAEKVYTGMSGSMERRIANVYLANAGFSSYASKELMLDKHPIKPIADLSEARIKQILKYNNVKSSETDVPGKHIRTFAKMDSYVNSNTARDSLSKLEVTEVTKSEDERMAETARIHRERRANRHGRGSMKILREFNVHLPAQKKGFDEFVLEHPDKEVLKSTYHGCDHTAASMILRYGFKVISSGDASVAGRMLGDGIYCAIHMDKAQQYLSGDGWARTPDLKGYIFEMKAALGVGPGSRRHGNNYASMGLGNDHIRSPEWCVFDEKRQPLIFKAYEVQCISENAINKILADNPPVTNEGKVMRFKRFIGEDMSVTDDVPEVTTYTFINGNIPTTNGHYVEFEKWSSDAKNVSLEPSARGPAVVVTGTDTTEDYLFTSPTDLMINHPDLYEKYLEHIG